MIFFAHPVDKESFTSVKTKAKMRQDRRDFRPLNGTNFSAIKIPASKWLSLIKLFELLVSTRRASAEVKLSYNITLRAFNIIRLSILPDSIAHGDEFK